MNENNIKILTVLRDESEIFNEFTDKEIELISPFFKQMQCSKDSFFFKEGEPSTFIAFIVSGMFEILKQTDIQANPIMLGRLATGSFTGESVLTEKTQTRAVSVVAVEDSEVLILNKSDLDHIKREYPEIGVKLLTELLRIVAIRLLKAVDKISHTF